MNDYLDSNKTKYTISDVEVSFNHGFPLTPIRRKVVIAMLIFMTICLLALLVVALVVYFTNQLEEGDESFYVIIAVVLVCITGVLGLISWSLKQSDKIIKQIEDCFEDAIEVTVTVSREQYVTNSLNHVLAYVAHFAIDGVEYVIPYQPALTNNRARKDITLFLGVECRALYSPRFSDVLILQALPSEEII